MTELAQEKIIVLNDLLKLDESERVKVRFHMYNGHEEPIDLFLNNPDTINTQWTFWRTKQRFFEVGEIVIALLRLGNDRWLLTTVKRVTKELGVVGDINYEGEELTHLAGYFGRVVIRFHKDFQTSRRRFESISNELIVDSMLPSVYDGDDFPGYDRVRLSWRQLKTILERNKSDWIAALSNQKAVYLITDRSNGKQYVGSATSKNGMLLERWRAYAENGHGENKELRTLIDKHGLSYAEHHFQYSILENYNQRTDDDEISKRETWWKETLCSRLFGYNSN